MSDFISEIKTVPYNDSAIYAILSDLSNLEKLRDRIPQDKMKNVVFDRDTCSLTIDPVGSVEFKVVEREPDKLIKLSTTNSPVPLNIWIQLKQVAEKDTKLKMTVRAELNAFIKPLVSKPLQEAVEKISDMLANLPYEQI